jgi:hypothetical protein
MYLYVPVTRDKSTPGTQSVYYRTSHPSAGAAERGEWPDLGSDQLNKPVPHEGGPSGPYEVRRCSSGKGVALAGVTVAGK